MNGSTYFLLNHWIVILTDLLMMKSGFSSDNVSAPYRCKRRRVYRCPGRTRQQRNRRITHLSRPSLVKKHVCWVIWSSETSLLASHHSCCWWLGAFWCQKICSNHNDVSRCMSVNPDWAAYAIRANKNTDWCPFLILTPVITASCHF